MGAARYRRPQPANHPARCARRAVFSPSRDLALSHDRSLMLRRRRHLHALGRACLLRHGVRWRVLSYHGPGSSQVAHARLQPYWTRYLGGRSYAQWALRPALYLCDVRHGTVVHAHRDRHVSVALEASGHSAPVPVHRLSLAAGDLCDYRHGMDTEYRPDSALIIAPAH